MNYNFLNFHSESRYLSIQMSPRQSFTELRTMNRWKIIYLETPQRNIFDKMQSKNLAIPLLFFSLPPLRAFGSPHGTTSSSLDRTSIFTKCSQTFNHHQKKSCEAKYADQFAYFSSPRSSHRNQFTYFSLIGSDSILT